MNIRMNSVKCIAEIQIEHFSYSRWNTAVHRHEGIHLDKKRTSIVPASLPPTCSLKTTRIFPEAFWDKNRRLH